MWRLAVNIASAFRDGHPAKTSRHPPLYMLGQRLVIDLLLLVTLVEREDGDVDACVVITAVQRPIIQERVPNRIYLEEGG